jgi:hypothetical protein
LITSSSIMEVPFDIQPEPLAERIVVRCIATTPTEAAFGANGGCATSAAPLTIIEFAIHCRC